MGVIPYKKYPLADPNTEWDAGEEVRKAEVEDLKEMCAWFDSENPDIKTAYKLPHHKADGYTTVWRAVAAAMAALLGARGGVDIPEADRKGVYNHLAKHYDDFEKEAPEFKSYDSGVERRSYDVHAEFEQREEGQLPAIVGHASVFNSLSEPIGEFREKILPGAFRDSIEKDDVCALWNHNSDYVLGRTSNETLKLEEDEEGLRCEIIPPNTTYASDFVESIRRGDVRQMSFGFIAEDEEWDGDVRILKKVTLFDVSPTPYPAYPQTDVSVRSFVRSIFEPKTKVKRQKIKNINEWKEYLRR
jgi:hypothetical protein